MLLWGTIAVLWLLSVVFVNWLYNFGPRLSSNYPPLDLFCPCGYILVIPLRYCGMSPSALVAAHQPLINSMRTP